MSSADAAHSHLMMPGNNRVMSRLSKRLSKPTNDSPSVGETPSGLLWHDIVMHRKGHLVSDQGDAGGSALAGYVELCPSMAAQSGTSRSIFPFKFLQSVPFCDRFIISFFALE